MVYTLVVPPDSPCGCESGKTFGECHLRDGSVNLVWKDMNPPLPMTGESVKKCHFAYTNNCGEGISREHVISKAVLKEIGTKKIDISTREFQKTLPLDSDALKIKRLCKRHNSGLSRIDTEAGRFIRTIQKADQILASRPEFPIRAYLFAGFDIERWLLKTMLNLYYSRQSVDPQKFKLPPGLMAQFNSPVRSPYGLYVPYKYPGGEKAQFKIEKTASFALVIEDDYVIGIKVELSGFEILYLAAGFGAHNPDFLLTHTQRPKTVVFFEGQETVVINLGWVEGAQMDIWISRGDPNAKQPEGIFSGYHE